MPECVHAHAQIPVHISDRMDGWEDGRIGGRPDGLNGLLNGWVGA
jgi:hypothetical protein